MNLPQLLFPLPKQIQGFQPPSSPIIWTLFLKFTRSMGIVKLEIPCTQNVNGVALDPKPDWSFEALLSELDSLEKKLNESSSVPFPFTKTNSRGLSEKSAVQRSPNAFVMRVPDFEESEDDDEDEGKWVPNNGSITAGRFNCDDLYLSDDSGDELDLGVQSCLMNEVGVVEGALSELTNEHQVGIKDEIRNKILSLETGLLNVKEKSTSACAQVEKYREARQEAERKLDVLYQRKIAEALDNHLTAVQREHELKSQREERRLRSDADEEAKRKEKALQEERLRQEKVKAEAEMQAKLRADEAKRAALEAERRAAKEAAEREAANTLKRNESVASKAEAVLNTEPPPSGSESDRTKKSQSAGNIIRAAKSALNLEQEREKKLKELDERNQTIRSSSNQDFSSHERHISRLIRQIRGIEENVRTKATELVQLINNPSRPQTISIATFAKKVVSQCASPDNAAFATSNVIVRVTSQFPHAMDLLLAEFHRACIYTIPKHIAHVESSFESKEAYCKAIGYREDEGKIESTEDYLKRLESYMRLYGALVQTEVQGFQNIHGLKEGWAWLARFLNALPANIYTAVALNAFLQMAGYALFGKYKSQFRKILNIISDNFLNALRAREDSELKPIIVEIQTYIEDKRFLQEPVGRSLKTSLLSSVITPDQEYPDSYPPSRDYRDSYHRSSRNYQDSYYHQSSRNYQDSYYHQSNGYYY
ncbi:hypothetical protein SLA2020_110250 [Shorea laevis]